MRYLPFCLFLLLLLSLPQPIKAQNTAYTVQSIPDPKSGSGNGYVSDPDNYISPVDEAELNRIIRELETTSTAQVAVVIVGSIGEENPKDFANRLFSQWGIGQADVDNGLLIFTVINQRRTEFETGYGLEGVLPDVVCYRIGMQELVPEFKEERYGQGLLNAVNRIKQTLEDPSTVEEITSNPSIRNNPYADGTFIERNSMGFIIYALISLVLGVIFGGRIFSVLRSREELYDKYLDLKKLNWIPLAFIFPLPFIFIVWFIRKRLKKLRYQPRYSRETGEPMRLLSEQEEDDYLERGQITEEAIGSVDYDVWVTDDEEDILILRYKKSFTRYKACPKCQYLTFYHAHTRVVRSATYTSTGSEKIVHKCKNCGHQKSKFRTIPRKVKSSSGGGSSGGFSGGGGSWGGGSSGGGGAGVSW